MGARLFQCPAGIDAGMHHCGLEFLVVVQQRHLPQPLNQVVAIFRLENPPQVLFGRPRAGRHGERQQMQIVITQHRDGGFAERADEAQRFQRFRPTIDQVPDEP